MWYIKACTVSNFRTGFVLCYVTLLSFADCAEDKCAGTLCLTTYCF